ncbi:CDGSH iron-sulfur domain-containing protein [Alisedimentitalea sp. MJ-SS2]|uniref:CDGSH iron-sulfur domain-containing protein n=1 Tax=Aliisedimentitalea sp. MJ-SS2 TaxID=3049795 RepID=UPI002915C214|nr:CDGSH iron-sulfur domain-containing protein [Alisedimentitalea sp. MJ-SS2]MDU8927879.1 CDGSH iron-sulfur domain-containing protein [Alisedimentitalea sp. MJ-SS2]
MSDKPIIEERENGPLVIKGLHRMVGPDGTEVNVKPVMALCRCGASRSKPFCDGSHAETGFESRGGTPAGRDRLITYEGAEVSVSYNPLLCSHAAECGRLASHIFNPAQKPWVQPDKGNADEVRAVVSACPSGALALAGEGRVEHLTAARAEVQIEKNGPYWVLDVTAPVEPSNEGASTRKYVLCRCGKSGNKPFCDGTHRDAGWRDDG